MFRSFKDYYRWFVKEFTSIARLLYDLVKNIKSGTRQRDKRKNLGS